MDRVGHEAHPKRGARYRAAGLARVVAGLMLGVAASAAPAGVSTDALPPRADRSPDPIEAIVRELEALPDGRSREGWLAEPAWVSRPGDRAAPAPLVTFGSGDPMTARPEPIPLPSALLAGPAFLTAVFATLAMKKRRPRARPLR